MPGIASGAGTVESTAEGSDAVLPRAVEIVRIGKAGLLRGPDESRADRVTEAGLGDLQEAAGAMIIVGENLVVLRPTEDREDILVSPALAAEIAPAEVIDEEQDDVGGPLGGHGRYGGERGGEQQQAEAGHVVHPVILTQFRAARLPSSIRPAAALRRGSDAKGKSFVCSLAIR